MDSRMNKCVRAYDWLKFVLQFFSSCRPLFHVQVADIHSPLENNFNTISVTRYSGGWGKINIYLSSYSPA